MNHLKSIFLLPALLLTACCFAQYGQEYDKYGSLPQKQDDFYYEIPFEYNGQIMMKAKIGDNTFDFAFDTGGYNMVTDAVQQQCKLEVVGESILGSANGIIKNTPKVYMPALALGELLLKDLQAYQVSFTNSPLMQCMISGGFIGAETIKNYIWQIDYPNRKIVVTNNIKTLYGVEKGTKLNVHLNKQNQPYVMVNINGTFQYMMFDTGCSSLLMFSDKDAERYTATARIAKLAGSVVETHNGRVRDTMYAFEANLDAGGIKINHKPALYRKGTNLTLLGSPIIKNYIVTLDFKDNALYLQPIKATPVTDGWEHFGFTLEYNGECVVIGALLQDSAAQKSGLLPGDEVVGVNGAKIACSGYCDCRETFNKLMDASSNISLLVFKNGKEQNITFKKEKIF